MTERGRTRLGRGLVALAVTGATLLLVFAPAAAQAQGTALLEQVGLVSVSSIALIGTGFIAWGRLNGRVRAHQDRLTRIEEGMEKLVTGAEFQLLLDRLEALHTDVRELRGVQNQPPKGRK